MKTKIVKCKYPFLGRELKITAPDSMDDKTLDSFAEYIASLGGASCKILRDAYKEKEGITVQRIKG